jgi:SAM-dependent methyltransferase
LFLHELDADQQSLRWLEVFAEQARLQRGPVLDVGCGPGGSVNHLRGLGLDAFGADISLGQLRQARRAFPDLQFELSDLTSLSHADSSLGGIVSRHAIIHLDPDSLGCVFREWQRVLAPDAPLFISFFGSRTSAAHGTPFDHKVTTAHELFPAAVGRELTAAGFHGPKIEAIRIPQGGRPFDHTTILTQRSPN